MVSFTRLTWQEQKVLLTNLIFSISLQHTGQVNLSLKPALAEVLKGRGGKKKKHLRFVDRTAMQMTQHRKIKVYVYHASAFLQQLPTSWALCHRQHKVSHSPCAVGSDAEHAAAVFSPQHPPSLGKNRTGQVKLCPSTKNLLEASVSWTS